MLGAQGLEEAEYEQTIMTLTYTIYGKSGIGFIYLITGHQPLNSCFTK
jgi:hypothetical protein